MIEAYVGIATIVTDTGGYALLDTEIHLLHTIEVAVVGGRTGEGGCEAELIGYLFGQGSTHALEASGKGHGAFYQALGATFIARVQHGGVEREEASLVAYGFLITGMTGALSAHLTIGSRTYGLIRNVYHSFFFFCVDIFVFMLGVGGIDAASFLVSSSRK